MRRTLILATACCVLAAAAAARADEVRITDPVGGTYRNGQVLTVKWDYTFLDHYPKTAGEKAMEISLRNHDTNRWYVGVAMVDVLSRGWSWAIKDIPPGRYIIYFTKPSEPLRGTCAVSEIFTIEEGSAHVPASPTTSASIRITSPVANATYYIGKTMPIRWDKSKIISEKNVWLAICWPDGKPAGGAFPAQNTGSYDWEIKETAENALRVCITSMADAKIKGMSGTFYIKFMPTLKKPVAGAKKIIKK